MAEMALVGSGIEHYQLWLGGTANLQRLAKPYLQRMQIDRLEATIKPLLTSWKKAGVGISFGDHIKNLGDQRVLSLLTDGEHAP